MSARIRHVAIYSENYDRMARFYQTVFGMKKITRSVNDPDRGHLGDGVIGLAINPRRAGINGGLDHYGFEVDDIEAVLTRLRSQYPKILITQALENAPFAVARSHDPGGSQFDISQRDIAKVRDGYKEDGWEQPRHLNHVVIRASEPELVAEFYQVVFGLKPTESLSGNGYFCLTDGKVRLLIHPTDNSPYTSMRQGLDHVGFRVESIEKVKQELDEIALTYPQAAPKKIAGGTFGQITLKEMAACRIGVHALSDPDGVVLDVSED